jgi:hypothetical protein
MARRRRFTSSPHYLINLGFSLGVLFLFSITGMRVAGTTTAATHNPYGQADYCALEDNVTVIYGWASDPDAGSLGQPSVMIQAGQAEVTAPTNRAGYRDTAIGAWIDANRAGDPKRGSYGFRATIPGLYKGTPVPISGTVLNEGNGTSVILEVNNSAPADGHPERPFFKDGHIPEECLAVPGATPAPIASTPSPATPVSKFTGAAVITGTLAADFRIQTDGAASVRVAYGEDPLRLDKSSSEIPVRGSETMVTLTGLKAAQSYGYRIIRTDVSGKKATSPLGGFDTLGYVLALHFVDSKNMGLQGVTAEIMGYNKKQTSNEQGDTQFTHLSAGAYTIQYKYLDRQFTRQITVGNTGIDPTETTAARVLTLDTTIDVEAAVNAPAPVSSEPQSNTGTVLVIAIVSIMTLVLCVLAVYTLTHVRKRRVVRTAVYNSPPPPLPTYQPLSPKAPPLVPGQPGAAHMGESLKAMVLRSMMDDKRTPPPAK